MGVEVLVPGLGDGEDVGIVGEVGVLVGAVGVDVELPELEVTPPQFVSAIVSTPISTEPSRGMAKELLLSARMLHKGEP